MIEKYTFTDQEFTVLVLLASIFHKGGRHLGIGELQTQAGIDRTAIESLLHRLSNYGFVEFTSTDTFELQRGIAALVEAKNNPPVKNYWEETIQWWFSARWRALFSMSFIIIPLLVQWIEMLKTLLKWTLS